MFQKSADLWTKLDPFVRTDLIVEIGPVAGTGLAVSSTYMRVNLTFYSNYGPFLTSESKADQTC